jgi:hypothetical protein
VSIDKMKLRNIATSIVTIPEHYRLVMEDSIPQGDEQERCFIWEDSENEDNEIEITLDLVTGHLTRLSIDREEAGESRDKDEAEWVGLEDEARLVADEFLSKHAPDPTEYTSVFIEKRRGKIEFTYREEIGGLPLPHTGCKLTLDSELNVEWYRLEGRKEYKASRPEWPDSIVDADTMTKHIHSNLQMKLTIVCLDPSIYEMKGTEQEYRLVYEPIQDLHLIDAVTGRDLFSPEHYNMPPSYPIQQIEPILEQTADEFMSWDRRLGINLEKYVLVKSIDDGEKIRSLYQLAEQEEDKPEPDALSVDAYMKRKWGDKLRNFNDSSIMIQLEKTTDRLVGFHWLGRGKEGAPALNREQCWTEADKFLRVVFPDYAEYLQLENSKEKSAEEPCEREFFFLPLYIDGIPVNHERVTICVSTSTGDVCNYMGVSYEMIRELAERSFLPILTPETAFDFYIKQMNLRLKWHLYSKQVVPVFRLLYEPATTFCDEWGKKRTLMYIDAVSGELIWSK